MSIWSRLFGGSSASDRVDYYEEALALSSEGKLHDALTSLRLALKDAPGDRFVLQQIAIVYTRIGMEKEAIKTYRHVLARHPDEPGAHYGLAFLLRRQGDPDKAVEHLEAFLANHPPEAEAGEHIAHARKVLGDLSPEPEEEDDAANGDGANGEVEGNGVARTQPDSSQTTPA